MKKLVSVINSQSLVRVSGVLVGKLVSMVLEEKGVKGREVDIVFVDDGRITGLNKMYLRKNRPTDVIAFGF
ncbi:MAG TPA: rRNA maturation RNAse YbeY, partial [bacterium]|nr:rRNA maturation RNAse YbeY [bacterium]